jgi:hypothetical protein
MSLFTTEDTMNTDELLQKEVTDVISQDLVIAICNSRSSTYDKPNQDSIKIWMHYVELIYFIKNYKDSSSLTNLNHIQIMEWLKDGKRIIFRFLCAPECAQFIVDRITTDTIIEFIGEAKTMPWNIIFEFADFSAGSIISWWNSDIIGQECPVILSSETTSGHYKLLGTKTMLGNSCHPALNTVSKLSSTEEVSIKFDNMMGTKIFELKNPDFEGVITRGYSLEKDVFRMMNKDSETELVTFPVHVEIKLSPTVILFLSSTHFCNLTDMSNIDIRSVRQATAERYGEQYATQFEEEVRQCTEPAKLQRYLSDNVRSLTS